MILKLLIAIAIFAGFSAAIVPLQCWNCVGPDCDSYHASSTNWELVTCPLGSVCQKTDFMFYSNQKNQSYKTYTVRSCSYETGCKWDRSKACRKNALEYAGKGCADKYCCGKDKCNGSQGWAATMSFLVVLTIFIF
ncbi:unnamed protein product [Caenorhabditis brenneri]